MRMREIRHGMRVRVKTTNAHLEQAGLVGRVTHIYLGVTFPITVTFERKIVPPGSAYVESFRPRELERPEPETLIAAYKRWSLRDG